VLQHAFGETMRAKRDYAMLAMLFGCGFRRSELVGLNLDDIQLRQGHWAVVDLIGKGGHIRTVPHSELGQSRSRSGAALARSAESLVKMSRPKFRECAREIVRQCRKAIIFSEKSRRRISASLPGCPPFTVVGRLGTELPYLYSSAVVRFSIPSYSPVERWTCTPRSSAETSRMLYQTQPDHLAAPGAVSGSPLCDVAEPAKD
jgi:hypothetical protein